MGKEVLVTDYLSAAMIEAGESIAAHLDPSVLVGEDVFWLRKDEQSSWQLVFSSPGASFIGYKKAYEYLHKILTSIPENESVVRLDQIVVLDTNSPHVQGLRHSLNAPFQRSHYGLDKAWMGSAYFEGVYVYRLTDTIEITCNLLIDSEIESGLTAQEGSCLGGEDVYIWAEGFSGVREERIIAQGRIELGLGNLSKVIIDMPLKYGISGCAEVTCISYRPGKVSMLGTHWNDGPMTFVIDHVKIAPLKSS